MKGFIASLRPMRSKSAIGAIGAALCALTALLPAGSAGAEEVRGTPFGYPAATLDAPATLASPPAAFVQIGRTRLKLGESGMEAAAMSFGAARLREGSDLFARDYACLAGTEGGEPVLLWLISSDLETVTEAQIERVTEIAIPAHCVRLSAEQLPFRLGPAGLGMTDKDLQEYARVPSRESGAWRFWFSQRFLKNARGLQELELNWLGVEMKDGKAVRAFASLVKNPS